MKRSNTVASLFIAAGAVLATGAVGLVIYRAQRSPVPPAASEVNEAQPSPTTPPPYGPGHRRPTLSPAEAARQKQQRAQLREKMNAMTEEQKEQFRRQVRERFSARPRAERESPSLVAPGPAASPGQLPATSATLRQPPDAAPTPAEAGTGPEKQSGSDPNRTGSQ